ncbi:hypothetical protein LWU68_20065 [Enterobacter cloacae]|uniref:hypothetical protein n=1 Tax=Enterobacter cloacae TaxID=550 RepID=UPI001E4D1776|nr:hypothetical protein [Enterobacter cloacae]MCE1399190.1 hypothetical protein [Enterobacter cloacae]
MTLFSKTQAAILLSLCATFSTNLHADQKFGFAQKCQLPDVPFPITFKVHDYLSNFAGMAYNIIYIPESGSNRSDLYDLYKNSDGYDYLSQSQSVSRGDGTGIYNYNNNSEGAMTSYISQPVCTGAHDCQKYPSDWVAQPNFGRSTYDSIKDQYPNDLIIVHSGMFPTLSDDQLNTTIFTTTRRFKLLRIEVFSVTDIEDPDVTAQWMHDTGAEPIVMEYRSSTTTSVPYYIRDDFSRLSRPTSTSPMKEFPQHLDKDSIQSMDFFIKYDGGKLGEIYTEANFHYFNDAQKAILKKCQ